MQRPRAPESETHTHRHKSTFVSYTHSPRPPRAAAAMTSEEASVPRPAGQRTMSSTSTGSGSGSDGSRSGSGSRSTSATEGLQVPRTRSGSQSPPTSMSSSPHDPHRRPSASILANPQEAPPRRLSATRSTKSALKAAFIPAQPGKQIKAGSKPLGKSFERKVPLPKDLKIQGGQVLERDPRGEDASAGDGVILTSPTSEEAPTTPSEAASSSYSGDLTDSFSWGQAAASTSTLTSTEGEGDSTTSGHRRSRTDTMSTDVSSTSSSTNSCSIRFAPLPVSGRLKRANSITIGVAARSQLLHSQGAGRNSGFNNTHPQYSQQYQHLPQRHHPQQASTSQANAWRSAGPQTTKPDDVIDLGEEISKRAKKAWLKMKGGKGGAAGEASATAAAKPTATPVSESGENTPRRASSPTSSLKHLSLEDSAKPSIDTIRAEESTVPDANKSGAATPRPGDAHADSHPQPHHLSRRLSTGAFLGNASLRGMQEERRREILGEAEEEELHPKTSKSRIVEPHRNPEQEEFAEDHSDEEEEEDEAELAEAQRLADESMQRSRENKAAGVEVVR